MIKKVNDEIYFWDVTNDKPQNTKRKYTRRKKENIANIPKISDNIIPIRSNEFPKQLIVEPPSNPTIFNRENT